MLKLCRFRGHEYDGALDAQCPTCKRITDREFTRRWRRANPDLAQRSHLESYVKRDRAQLAERARQWALNNLERKRAHRRKNNQQRRAVKRDAPCEAVEAIVVWERDGGRCHVCSDEVSFYAMQIDHVVPLSRGGPHTYANVKAAHADCNNWKNGRLMEELH